MLLITYKALDLLYRLLEMLRLRSEVSPDQQDFLTSSNVGKYHLISYLDSSSNRRDRSRKIDVDIQQQCRGGRVCRLSAYQVFTWADGPDLHLSNCCTVKLLLSGTLCNIYYVL